MKYFRVFHPAGRCAVPIRSRRIGHGVLAPNAKLRSEIVPREQKNERNSSDAHDDENGSSAPVRISWARLLKRVFKFDVEQELPLDFPSTIIIS
jgi:hypothetical protein